MGWFDDTLPGFLAEHDGPIAFLHVDGDLYSSARTVLDLCGPRLVEGSVVIFDEYFNFPGWEQHEHRAWQEFVAGSGIEFVVEAYTVDDEQVVMRITRARHGDRRSVNAGLTGRDRRVGLRRGAQLRSSSA